MKSPEGGDLLSEPYFTGNYGDSITQNFGNVKDFTKVVKNFLNCINKEKNRCN